MTLIGIVACWVCSAVFAFDPATVPVVLVDPHTGSPPDIDPATGQRQPTPQAAIDRSVRRPLCPACVAVISPARAARGLPPLDGGQP